MKKKFLTAVLALLVMGSGVTFAQEKSWYFGPKVGANITTISNVDAQSWRGGVNVGMFAMHRYNDFLGFQADVMFSMMGADFQDGANLRLNYISVPMLAKLYLYKSLNLELGPQIGFKVFDQFNLGDNTSITDHDMYNTMDVSFVAGLGYEFSLIGLNFMTEARYVTGLTNPIKSEFNEGKNNKNQMIQLSLGWIF